MASLERQKTQRPQPPEGDGEAPAPALRLIDASTRSEHPARDLGELLRLAKLRDPEALRALFRRYAPRVHGLLRRTLGQASETEDAVQEVFLRLFSKLD